jgi:hypothetical protein
VWRVRGGRWRGGVDAPPRRPRNSSRSCPAPPGTPATPPQGQRGAGTGAARGSATLTGAPARQTPHAEASVEGGDGDDDAGAAAAAAVAGGGGVEVMSHSSRGPEIGRKSLVLRVKTDTD